MKFFLVVFSLLALASASRLFLQEKARYIPSNWSNFKVTTDLNGSVTVTNKNKKSVQCVFNPEKGLVSIKQGEHGSRMLFLLDPVGNIMAVGNNGHYEVELGSYLAFAFVPSKGFIFTGHTYDQLSHNLKNSGVLFKFQVSQHRKPLTLRSVGLGMGKGLLAIFFMFYLVLYFALLNFPREFGQFVENLGSSPAFDFSFSPPVFATSANPASTPSPSPSPSPSPIPSPVPTPAPGFKSPIACELITRPMRNLNLKFGAQDHQMQMVEIGYTAASTDSFAVIPVPKKYIGDYNLLLNYLSLVLGMSCGQRGCIEGAQCAFDYDFDS